MIPYSCFSRTSTFDILSTDQCLTRVTNKYLKIWSTGSGAVYATRSRRSSSVHGQEKYITWEFVGHLAPAPWTWLFGVYNLIHHHKDRSTRQQSRCSLNWRPRLWIWLSPHRHFYPSLLVVNVKSSTLLSRQFAIHHLWHFFFHYPHTMYWHFMSFIIGWLLATYGYFYCRVVAVSSKS
jgi:hypothetical protein